MKFWHIIICILIIFLVVLLTGCPQKIPSEVIESGDYYKTALNSALHSKYGINFSEENMTTVSVTYQVDENTIRAATFQLDGYDDEKKI
jgi:hypothetical protein